MSADTQPISTTRFASALKDLSVDMLHLKVLEIRNSIAHLQYSNDQLKPFAEGTSVPLSSSTQPPPASSTTTAAAAEPDQDCIDAIRENELVIDRMAERIALIRAEVEERGVSWTEFQSRDELLAKRAAEQEAEEAETQATPLTNGSGQEPERAHSAWTDGTFQTGTIRNGEVHFDSEPGRRRAEGADGDVQGVVGGSSGGVNGGGRLDDEQLRQAMEERMRNLSSNDEGDDDNSGIHL